MSNEVKISDVIQPFYTDVLITLKTEKESSLIIMPEDAKSSMISETQEVLAIGPNCTMTQPGDTVRLKMLNIMVMDGRMIKGKTSNELDEVQSKRLVVDPSRTYTIDGVDYMLIREGDIAYKILKNKK